MPVVLLSTDTVMLLPQFVQINVCVISYRTTASACARVTCKILSDVDYNTVHNVDPDGL